MPTAAAADQFDMVLRPKHYNSHPSGVEVITITRLLSFDPGNAFKYVARYEHKFEPAEDLEKAVFYLNDAIVHRTRIRVSKRQLAEFVTNTEAYLAVEPEGWAKDALTAIVNAGLSRTRRRGVAYLQQALVAVQVGIPLVKAEVAARRAPAA